MIDYLPWFQPFYEWLPSSPLAPYEIEIKKSIHLAFEKKNSDLLRWFQQLQSLPQCQTDYVNFSQNIIQVGTEDDLTLSQRLTLKNHLKEFKPWKKGPFSFFDIVIDTEWRSDWKWDRIKNEIQSLKNKVVLDIGCGSGYHCWRILGENARYVIGIDSSMRNLIQFKAFQRYAGHHYPIALLPIRFESFPMNNHVFDTIFSMGVLYHCKSPIEHLQSIFGMLKKNGEVVIETLIIDGDENTVLTPENRYAMMPNVWFIPSVQYIIRLLKRLKFKNVRFINKNKTTIEEQRSTEWSTEKSLIDFLHPEDKNKTIEGYPAPERAFFIAKK